MARRALRFRWRKREKTVSAEDVNFQAVVLIHLGQALRCHRDGETLRAIRHLGAAAEVIMALIEEWSGGSPKVEIIEEEVTR